jgi:endonuclease/exonuclease/phosphatase family metal-dependent hydrolase
MRYAANCRALRDIASDPPLSLLCLQEADPAFVEAVTNACPRYGVARHFVNGSGEGTCILLDKSVSVSETAAVDLGGGKSAVAVLLQPTADISAPVWVVSLHLQGGGGDEMRRTRAGQLNAIQLELGRVGPRAGIAAILCGDWNDSNPASMLDSSYVVQDPCAVGPAAAALAAAGVSAKGPATGLSGDFSSRVAIDWVAARAGAIVSRPVVRHVPSDPWAPGSTLGSDHVPVTFTVY